MNSYDKLKRQFLILIADDDADDRELFQEAFSEVNSSIQLAFVQDGEELMEYLLYTGRYANIKVPMPSLILLDLNMPKKDGREALQEIKENPELARIPVLVLSTSQSAEDIFRTYQMGGNSFISKPSTYRELVRVADSINKFWCDFVRYPIQ